MEFIFKEMDFNDISTLYHYGDELFEEEQMINDFDNNIIDVNMKDTELKNLIDSIPTSIDDKIDDISEQTELPLGLSMADKLLSNALLSILIPKSVRKNLEAQIQDTKEQNDDKCNSTVIYNNIMENIDAIKDKLTDEAMSLESVVSTLENSKKSLIELVQKFNTVIDAGERAVENFKNNEEDSELKQNKLDVAENSLLSLKKSRTALESFIQSKDVSTCNLYIYALNIRDWLKTTYKLLSRGVSVSIETKYISNKVDMMKNLNDTSNNVITDSSLRLKEATQKNIQMLTEGSLKVETINKFLKDVNTSLTPVKQFIENKGRATEKLKGDIAKLETQINENRDSIASISENYGIPMLEENGTQKTLKLGAKTINND